MAAILSSQLLIEKVNRKWSNDSWQHDRYLSEAGGNGAASESPGERDLRLRPAAMIAHSRRRLLSYQIAGILFLYLCKLLLWGLIDEGDLGKRKVKGFNGANWNLEEKKYSKINWGSVPASICWKQSLSWTNFFLFVSGLFRTWLLADVDSVADASRWAASAER